LPREKADLTSSSHKLEQRMMCVDIAQLDPLQIYVTLTQTVIPRPITWVLSENANGSL
jgi:hypothetical protein